MNEGNAYKITKEPSSIDYIFFFRRSRNGCHNFLYINDETLRLNNIWQLRNYPLNTGWKGKKRIKSIAVYFGNIFQATLSKFKELVFRAHKLAINADIWLWVNALIVFRSNYYFLRSLFKWFGMKISHNFPKRNERTLLLDLCLCRASFQCFVRCTFYCKKNCTCWERSIAFH